MLLKELKEEYLFDCVVRELSKRTVHNYELILSYFVEYLCVSPTSWQAFSGYAAQKLLQPRANASATEPQILQLSGSGKRHYVKAIW